MTPAEMAMRAETLRRRDLFRLNHFGMLMERMRSPSIYLEDPLRDLCRSVVPPGAFTQLKKPLLVNTVDLERGEQLVWGTPGLMDVNVQDAVYASCALPGFFPPGRVAAAGSIPAALSQEARGKAQCRLMKIWPCWRRSQARASESQRRQREGLCAECEAHIGRREPHL